MRGLKMGRTANGFKLLGLLLTGILFVGCATTQQNTPPPVTYISKSVPLNRIKGAIIDTYTAEGWQLEKESDHMLSFLLQNDNALSTFLYSSQYESRVFNRETVTISEGTDGITLRAAQYTITNYGSAFEKSAPVAGKGGTRLATVQSILATKPSR